MNRSLGFLLAILITLPAFAGTNESDVTQTYTLADTRLKLDDRFHPPRYRKVRRTRVKRVKVQRAEPKPPSRLGPYFTFGGLGHFIIDDTRTSIDNAYNGGGGFIIGLGFRISPMLALEANWAASFQSTSVQTTLGNMPVNAIHSLNLDAKVFFIPNSRRIEPFLQVGIGAYMLSESFAYELSGFGFDIGGGVDIRFTEGIGLGLKVLYRGFLVDNTGDDHYVFLQQESAFVDSISAEAALQFYF